VLLAEILHNICMGETTELSKRSTDPYFLHPSFSSQTLRWWSFHCQILPSRLQTRPPWDKVGGL